MRNLLSQETKSIISRIIKVSLKPLILLKWRRDMKYGLPLTASHFEIYYNIHHRYWVKFFKFPNLTECEDFNDKINWLKLFDQDKIAINCCDKVGVRDFVKERIGSGYLPELYQVADNFDGLDLDSLPCSMVIKTNHDSGTVFLVNNKEDFDKGLVGTKISNALSAKFGMQDGEWPYALVSPKVFAEEMLESKDGLPPADYKFHCVNGHVKWLQYIYDRGVSTKEVIIDANGCIENIHFDRGMHQGSDFVIPECWPEMISVVEKLSNNFKYLRVDLYLINNSRILVGELTFFPLAGLYSGSGQIELGRRLDFDRQTYKKCIVNELLDNKGISK